MSSGPKLTVVVVGAKGLRGVDLGKTSDPYCILRTMDGGESKSIVKKKQNDPIWMLVHEVTGMQRRVEVEKGAYKNSPIEVEVWDWNKIMKHTLLGRVRIDITPLKADVEHVLSLPLIFDAHDNSKFPAQGTVQVKIHYSDPGMPDEMLKQYQEDLKLGESRLNDLYASYFKKGHKEQDNIKSLGQLLTVLKDAHLLEVTVAAWQNRQPSDVGELCRSADLLRVVGQEIFDTLDQDHSGSISFSELLLGLAIILEGSNTEKMFRFRFKATDTNGDGQLSFEEATKLSGFILRIVSAALSTALTQTKQKFKDAGATDKDLKELNEAFHRVLAKSNLAQKETEILFKFADQDNSGAISEQEYVNFMLDKEQQAKRDEEFSEVVGPICETLGKEIGLTFVELGRKLKARYGR